MTLYIDVLFIENVVVNFFILKAVAVLLGLQSKHIRLLIGAVIGGIYVVAMVVWPGFPYVHILSKFILSIVITAVAFKPSSPVVLFKSLVLFYMGSFLLAGILTSFGSSSDNVHTTGILTALLLFVMIFLLLREFAMKKYKNCEYNVSIWMDNRNITLPAQVDTGNSLREPVTRIPVIVVETKTLEPLLPLPMYRLLNGDMQVENDEKSEGESWRRLIRYIPYNTLDRPMKIMVGFEPDYVDIWGGDLPKKRKKAVVGLSARELKENGSIKALIHPALMD